MSFPRRVPLLRYKVLVEPTCVRLVSFQQNLGGETYQPWSGKPGWGLLISWEPTSTYLPKGAKVEVTGLDPELRFTQDEFCEGALPWSEDEIIAAPSRWI